MPSYLKLGLYIVVAFALVFLSLRLVPENMNSFKNHYFDSKNPEAGVQPIDWRILRELNISTGQTSIRLKSLDNKRVKIPGFIVPLEDDQSQVSEFLLVPSPLACIHVPPPPPNQMIYVRMKDAVPYDLQRRAVWVEGQLKLSDVDSPYGVVFYEMDGEKTSVFDFNKPNDL